MGVDGEITRMLDDSAEARERMVTEQILARGVPEGAVTRAMLDLPRELFVDVEHTAQAYDDCALPIGPGQTVSQPYIVAYMTHHLQMQRQHCVLEIGTGSGYQAAILGALAGCVETVERDATLSARAAQRLARLGLAHVRCRVGDGSSGLAEAAPFDRILVTAGCPQIPEPLIAQLADGGILLAPVGKTETQTLVRVRKDRNGTDEQALLPCRFVKLYGVCAWPD